MAFQSRPDPQEIFWHFVEENGRARVLSLSEATQRSSQYRFGRGIEPVFCQDLEMKLA
jgi:hypothetical protein